MTTPDPTVYRYAYTSRRDDKRYIARVTIHDRYEVNDLIVLMLRPVGRWPDREDLNALADETERRGIPMVSVILLTHENEAAWCEANLRPEDGKAWAA